MKLAEALAEDMPLRLRIKPDYRTPIAWLWELRDGGIAFVAGGHRHSPSCEAHVHHGEVSGNCPWTVIDRDRTDDDGKPLVVDIIPSVVDGHVPERGTEEGALNYLFFWHQFLPKDSVIRHNRGTRAYQRL